MTVSLDAAPADHPPLQAKGPGLPTALSITVAILLGVSSVVGLLAGSPHLYAHAPATLPAA